MTNATLFTRLRRPALIIFAAALILRLAFVLILEPSPDFSGGDANWYMKNGRDLVKFGKTLGPLQTAPLYPVFLGVVQMAIPGEPSPGLYYTQAEMQTVRAVQAVLGAGLCVAVYWIARRLFGERAARLAGAIMAASPALIVEAGNLTTEGVFLMGVFGGLALYLDRRPPLTSRRMVEVGIAFGLATLTRAVFLLFPLVIVAHLILTERTRWTRLAAALLISYGLVVSTWTVYNLAVWDRFVIGGEGLWSFLYQGAEGRASPEETDSQIGITPDLSHEERQEVLRESAAESITADPVGWAAHRIRELADSYLQPHNTVHYGGRSVKDALVDWLRNDRSAGGLADLTRLESFWPKLALYVFHFTGLLLGAAGMILAARRWRALLPLYAVVIYFTGIHLVLLALPRYVFPTYPVFWMFAAAAVVHSARHDPA
mgnify:CR=1 FL=1